MNSYMPFLSGAEFKVGARVRSLQAEAKAHPMARANQMPALVQLTPDVVLGLSVNA